MSFLLYELNNVAAILLYIVRIAREFPVRNLHLEQFSMFVVALFGTFVTYVLGVGANRLGSSSYALSSMSVGTWPIPIGPVVDGQSILGSQVIPEMTRHPRSLTGMTNVFCKGAYLTSICHGWSGEKTIFSLSLYAMLCRGYDEGIRWR